MSFGAGGFGTGFGQNNNQQSPGFGFGSTQNTNTGFGATNNTGGFGSTNTTGGGIFGGGSTGGFGSSGGFGTQNNAFGSKPGGFGATTTTAGASLFGGGTATAGSTGFNAFGTSTPAAQSSPFGANNNSNSLFGQNKTGGFGANTSTTFGAGGTSSPFGATTNAFGAPASSALAPSTGECQGTGSVPFQATIEKEPNSTSNQQNAFQSITFQAPYQKFSFEELRLADYTQGRKHGNASNQAGAFGSGTGFGAGFGSNNQTTNSGFGANNTGASLFGGGATNSPFGGTQTTSSGFGSTAGTAGAGLFGASKPAASIFGAPAQTPPATGLFGNTGTSGGFGGTSGFGANNTTTGSTTLFGANNAAKPPTFSFNNATASTGTGFGTTPASTGFGTGGLFGNNQQQNTTNAFGSQQQQQQPATTNLFGGGGGGGGFGSTQQNTGTPSLFNQPKPATGLFGAPANTGTGGLFGNNQPAASTNAFGASNNTQNTGGLFGNPKPATSGLFGQPNNQTTTGGSSLFSGFGAQNQNQNQPQTNNLFGGLNNTNNQQKSSLFPQAQQQPGPGLFGAAGAQPQQGASIFGGSLLGNNQQPQQPQQNASIFGGNNSFLGNSQQTPQSFTASLSDPTAFGGTSLFASLNGPPVQNPGPIATPMSNSVTKRKTAALPMYKLQPASSSRFSTPARRGFGFSYSNYNSPGSASSTTSTPGSTFNSSLLGGTFGRGLSKSMSTSSLRRSFNTEDSILAPGAFSASPSARHYGSTGSMKKLVINRGIRNDLFSPPKPPSETPSTPNGSILKKRVSFDSSTIPSATNGTSSPLKQTQNNTTPALADLGYERPRAETNGATSLSEMEQVKGNELARVPEEDSPASPPKPPAKPVVGQDMDPGPYWMSPSKEAIEKLNRVQRQKVSGFTIGRDGTGQVTFDVPVDLTAINLDDLFGKIVVLVVRSLTVYPDPTKKPPMGKGLNVPSTITLANSWPRKHGRGTRQGSQDPLSKHIANLRKVPDTEFIDYEAESGIWRFKVDHFTTYKFYEDDDDEGVSQFGESTLSAPPDTPTPKPRTPMSQQFDQSFESTSQGSRAESDPEDTFQFRKKKLLPLPGAFDDQEVFVDEDMVEEYDGEDQESFLDECSVGSQSENGVEEPMDQDDVFEYDESVGIVDQEMAGSFPQANTTAELGEGDSQDEESMGMVLDTPGAVVKARMRAAKNAGTPAKSRFAAGNDWTNTLKTTISPQKQDRALLKSLIDVHDNDSRLDKEPTQVAPKNRVVSDGRGFATSIDLMNSLFGQTRSPSKAKVPVKAKGFEWPYAKRSKTNDSNTSDMSEIDRAFHDSMKPSWGPDGTLVFATVPSAKPSDRSSRRSRERDGLLTIQKGGVVSESRDIRFAKFSNEASADALKKQQAMTLIEDSGDAPYATLPKRFSFSDFLEDDSARNPAAVHEKLVWQLASILFDDVVVPNELQEVVNVSDRLRKDELSNFWQKLVDHASTQQVAMARSQEEKAIASLSSHRVPDACGHLLNGKDFHLATLVALIGKDSNRKGIREQLSDWQKQHVLSEFSQPIRAIYEILAGNVCVCDGSKGGPIEDRIDTFIISERFGLDWRQAFGLRLWYGILSADDLGAAVENFAEDLAQHRETAKPQAWYVEQKIPTLWEDGDSERREDLLWGLLRLYAFQDCDLEAVIRPENSQLSPVDIRLSWQLSRALTSCGVVNYSQDSCGKADQITLSFASQLASEGSWLDAVFVLLHISSAEARAKSIQNHLAQHAARIGSDDSQSFTTLTQTYKVPAPWVWEAKALYLRSVKKDPTGEVECLIRAGSFDEAHRTFCKEVAPKAIIERDYDTLRTLLNGFKSKDLSISDWPLGGSIYRDFLDVLDSQKKAGPVDYSVLARLLAGLPVVVEESRHPGFMETVAIETISGIVAKTVVEMGKKGEKNDLSKVLRLPLTEDEYLKHTVNLSLGFYRDVMAGGR